MTAGASILWCQQDFWQLEPVVCGIPCVNYMCVLWLPNDICRQKLLPSVSNFSGFLTARVALFAFTVVCGGTCVTIFNQKPKLSWPPTSVGPSKIFANSRNIPRTQCWQLYSSLWSRGRSVLPPPQSSLCTLILSSTSVHLFVRLINVRPAV